MKAQSVITVALLTFVIVSVITLIVNQSAHSALEAVQTFAKQIMAVLELSSSPVGARLLPEDTELPESARVLNQYRYCQALMMARCGEHVLLDGRGIACPAAVAVFGFRPLPKELQSGRGLVGFGIVKDAVVG